MYRCTILLSLLFFSVGFFSQEKPVGSILPSYLSLGVQGGISYYIGELNTTHFASVYPSIGITLNNLLKNQRFSHVVGLHYARLGAKNMNDNYIHSSYNFSTNIFDLTYRFRMYFKDYNMGVYYPEYSALFISYGVGFMYYTNPVFRSNGNTYTLKNISDNNGTNVGMLLTASMGHIYNITSKAFLTIEYILNYTLTDNLDYIDAEYSSTDIMSSDDDILSIFSNKQMQHQKGQKNLGDIYGILKIGISFPITREKVACLQDAVL